MDKFETLQNTLRLLHKHIGFAHLIPAPDKLSALKTKFGMQTLGSPLSYQLAPVEFNLEVHISLLDEKLPYKNQHTPFEYFTDLPVKCRASPPKEIDYSVDEKCLSVLDTLKITMEDARLLETNTRKQASCKEWFSAWESRITASKVHRISICKRQFRSLADQFVINESKDKPDLV